jgi:tetratricopeptide (TPR) repeat protein
METPQEQVLKPGDLEGLVLDKFFVDALKPKLCDKKDIAVVNFLVKKRDPANDLSSYIAQGQFDLIDVEASSSPDEDGNYTLLVEMNRNPEMFDIMDNLLQHITSLVNIKQWHFKPQDHDEFIVWNKENFVNTVPQSLESYFENQDAYIEEDQTDSTFSGTEASEFNYQLLGKVIEERITKSNRAYIKAFQKQFKVIIKGNQSLMQHIEDLKSDHQYLHQQLELYEQREKMALLREQQGFKRIRALEHQLSLMGPYDADNSEIVIPKASVPVTLKSAEVSDVSLEPHEDTETWNDDKKGTESIVPDGEDVSKKSAVQGDEGPAKAPEIEEKSADKAASEDIVPDIDTSAGDTTQSEVTTDDKDKAGAAKEGVMISGPSTDRQKDAVKKLVAQGLAAVKGKEYNKAIEFFTQVTELVPNARRSLLRIAVLYYRLKDYEAAREHAQRALNLGAESAKRILAKIEDKQTASADGPVSEEPVESPTEEAIIWSTDDFDEDFDASEVSATAPSGEIAAEQDVIIFGQTAEVQTSEDSQPQTEIQAEESMEVESESSTETVVMDFETVKALRASLPSTGKPEASSETDTAKEYFSQGLKAFEQKEYHNAIDYFTKVTELLPNARRSFIRLAALYYRLKDYDIAKIHAHKALELGSASAKRILEKIEAKQPAGSDKPPDIEFADTVSEKPPFDNLVGASLPEDADQKTGEGSEPSVRKKEDSQKVRAEQASPPPIVGKESPPKIDDAKKYFTRGVKAFEQKQYQKAIEYFTRVTKLLPQAPRSFMRLAVLYYRLKDYETARIHAQQALGLGSDTAQRILEKIDSKQAMGADASASDEFADTLPEFPTLDVTEASDLIAGISNQTPEEQEDRPSGSPAATGGDSDQQPLDPAEEMDAEAFTMGSATESVSLDTDTLTSSGISQAPEKDSDSFPKTDPVSDYFALGLAAAEQESYHKAIENFTKVTELLPEAPASYLNLANLYLKLKDYEQAKDNAKRASDLGSESAKRILEQLEADRWEASAISASSGAESTVSE